METRSHSPQDELYGPLNIPSYCWEFIDTPEYQRMRYIPQLGCASLIFTGATHTRFEHSLGCAHLAFTFLDHISRTQPEIEINDEHRKAVIIAALCHDIGHGPWSHCFEDLVESYDKKWDHEKMSCDILRFIVKKYSIKIDENIINATCNFIQGIEFPGYPRWMSQIVANKDYDIDIDKFDYLARDMNNSLCITHFEYDRLIYHCRVVEDKLTWKLSEIPTIERLFFNRNDMHQRVYQHRAIQACKEMILDMLKEAEEHLKIKDSLENPEAFCKFDCRLQYCIKLGSCGEAAQKIEEKISLRKLYKFIGEIRLKPENTGGITYLESEKSQLCKDIAKLGKGIDANVIRVVLMKFRYGLNKKIHPLLSIPFRKPDEDEIIFLSEDDISCISPSRFTETGMRVFITDPEMYNSVKKAFDLWKIKRGLFSP